MGGMLVQDKDSGIDERDGMEVVTKRHPTEKEWGDAMFAWRVAKHVRSNAIVLANDLATLGIGAGQMSRVDSMNIALDKSSGRAAGRGGRFRRLLPVHGRARSGDPQGHHASSSSRVAPTATKRSSSSATRTTWR